MHDRRLIWIPPTDGDRNPVDPRFAAAAYQLAAYALRYRQGELRDEAVATSMLNTIAEAEQSRFYRMASP
jgi:hypothetical protein